jgi:hypothetical protein
MSRVLRIALGILTAIGGLVDIGDLVANALDLIDMEESSTRSARIRPAATGWPLRVMRVRS